jgi:uncharacterized membrane protein YhaH (DUF805 family)
MKLLQFYWTQLTKNAFKFSGRTSRSDFWKFCFIQFFFILLFSILLDLQWPTKKSIEIIYLVFFYGTLIQWFAITVRRLHDTDRSAWHLLVLLIPIVGVIGMIVYTIDESDEGDNKYGPHPKQPIE